MLPFSVGNDVCHITRIFQMVCTKKGPQLIRRILTKEEIAQPRAQHFLKSLLATESTNGGKREPLTEVRRRELKRAAEYLAGRFAAKEAVIKAHHQHKLTYHRIEIRQLQTPSVAPQGQEDQPSETESDPRSSGPPIARVRTGGGQDASYFDASISISHDGDYAFAVCLGVNGVHSASVGSSGASAAKQDE